jgi:hypothetical protein
MKAAKGCPRNCLRLAKRLSRDASPAAPLGAPVFSLQSFIGQDQERQYFLVRQQERLLLNLETLCVPKIEPGVGADLSWVGAIPIAFASEPQELIGSATFHFARAAAYSLVNMVKVASVFMITTSTVAIYTGIAPRWLAFMGFALAFILLFGSFYMSWSFLVFPLWVFLISASFLKNGRPTESAVKSDGST